MSNSSAATGTSLPGAGHEEAVKTDVEAGASGPNPFRSDGAIGKHFNPEGSIGNIAQTIGGPLSKDGFVGEQFDASKDGIAGSVEKMTGGPRKIQDHGAKRE